MRKGLCQPRLRISLGVRCRARIASTRASCSAVSSAPRGLRVCSVAMISVSVSIFRGRVSRGRPDDDQIGIVFEVEDYGDVLACGRPAEDDRSAR